MRRREDICLEEKNDKRDPTMMRWMWTRTSEIGVGALSWGKTVTENDALHTNADVGVQELDLNQYSCKTELFQSVLNLRQFHVQLDFSPTLAQRLDRQRQLLDRIEDHSPARL